MKILVFGQTGQVAVELRRRLPNATYLSRAQADLEDPRACAEAVLSARPDLVINAAAYTSVDKAEAEPERAYLVNAAAPAAIARAAARTGAAMVHVSTDYVFDGSGKAPWRPGDPTGPLNAYGRTKLAGEIAVQEADGAHVILRTSWVFSAHGSNFVKTMLRLGRTRDSLSIVSDQIGGPTPAGAIASALIEIGSGLRACGPSGVYHLSGAPCASWADFARDIFSLDGLSTQVVDIPTAEYPTPAPRPRNSRLDCSALHRDYGIVQPDWRASLASVLQELKT